jgi:hypothetical protein
MNCVAPAVTGASTLSRGVKRCDSTLDEVAGSLVAGLPPHLVRFERFANCGHSLIADAPDHVFEVIHEFISA